MNDVCSAKYAQYLDNWFRRVIHNPETMFGRYIKPGNTILDIGCGPGTFTAGLASLTGESGKVIAIDLQKEMLQMAHTKISAAGMLDRVKFHQCSETSLEIEVKADFILTFYMVHEAPAPLLLTDQICELLGKGGYYYLAEPKGHVSKKQFELIVNRCIYNGLSLVKQMGLLSRIAVFQK